MSYAKRKEGISMFPNSIKKSAFHFFPNNHLHHPFLEMFGVWLWLLELGGMGQYIPVNNCKVSENLFGDTP